MFTCRHDMVTCAALYPEMACLIVEFAWLFACQGEFNACE